MSSKTFRYVGDGKDKISELKSLSENFIVVTTSKTVNVRTRDFNYLFSEKHYYGKIFGLLAQLKKMLTDNADVIFNCPFSGNARDVNYFMFSESKRNFKLDTDKNYEIPNVIEADISMAYYKAFYILGFINEDFYLKCKNLDKEDRLILIGSIATVRIVDYYEKGVRVKSLPDKNDLFRMAWFKGCSYVDAALITLKERFNELSPDIFLFYWVDGIYFRDFQVTKNYNWQTIFKEIQELFPFEWKYVRIKKIICENDGKVFKINIVKPSGETKVFNYPKKDVRYYYLDKNGKPVDIDISSLPLMSRVYFK